MLALTLGLVIQSTPINVESPGIRVVNLVPKLAAESRLPLSVVPFLENDVVSIRTMGRPWGEVKANLAKVLNATWEEKDGRFVLTQTSEQQKADRDFQRASMVELLAEKIRGLSKHYSDSVWTAKEFNTWYERSTKKPSSELSPAARRNYDLENRRSGPQGRLVARIFNQIKPEQLVPADLDWEGHVFATDKLVLHDYTPLDLRQPLKLFADEKQMIDDRAGSENEGMPGEPVGALFRISQTRNSALLSVDLYDKTGTLVDFFFDFERPKESLMVQQTKSVAPLSQLIRDLATADQGFRESINFEDDGSVAEDPAKRAQLTALVQKLRERLSRSEQDDPLALYGGDDWQQLSREKAQPMMALLADSVSSVAALESPKLNYGPYRLDDGGWLLGSQRNQFDVRRKRADRRAVARSAPYASNLRKDDLWPGIEGIFRRATAQYDALQGRVDRISRLNLFDFEFTIPGENETFVPLVGALTPDERRRLLSGQLIPLGSLNGNARQVFREQMFLSEDILGNLDARIPAVAFPGVEQGLWLRGKVSTSNGYMLSRNVKGRLEPLFNQSYDDLAYLYADGLLPTAGGELYLAPASCATLEISLRTESKSADNKIESSWQATSKAVPFSSLDRVFLEKLRKRGEELKKDDGDGG